jgi:hypothetical protein
VQNLSTIDNYRTQGTIHPEEKVGFFV